MTSIERLSSNYWALDHRTSDYEQQRTAHGCTEVAGFDHPPLDNLAHAFQQRHEPAPGRAAALGIWYQELLMYRHNLARRSDLAAQLHHPPGDFVALGDQRAPLQDLLDVLQADDPGPLLTGPFQANPRQVADLTLARLAAGGLAVVGAVRARVKPADGAPAAFFVRNALEYVGGVVPGRRVVGGVHADRCRVVFEIEGEFLLMCGHRRSSPV